MGSDPIKFLLNILSHIWDVVLWGRQILDIIS